MKTNIGLINDIKFIFSTSHGKRVLKYFNENYVLACPIDSTIEFTYANLGRQMFVQEINSVVKLDLDTIKKTLEDIE